MRRRRCLAASVRESCPCCCPSWIRLARAEQRDPARAAELRDLELLRRVYQSVVATARAGILDVVPAVRLDPIAAGA